MLGNMFMKLGQLILDDTWDLWSCRKWEVAGNDFLCWKCGALCDVCLWRFCSSWTFCSSPLCLYVFFSVTTLEGCDMWKLCFLSKALLFLTTCIAEWLLIFSDRLDWKTDIYCVNHPGNHHPGLWHWSFSTDSLQSQAYYQTHNQPSKCWLLKTVSSLFL